MDFFPDPPDPPDDDEVEESPQPVWAGPPDDVLAGGVPVGLVLGQSASTVVLLSAIRAFPTGLQMDLGVRIRGPVGRWNLSREVFDHPGIHDDQPEWRTGRLKWGFELADGRRATNVDHSAWLEQPNQDHSRPQRADDSTGEPDRPVLTARGGGGGPRSVEWDVWLWPLPPAGRLRVACEWPDRGIELTVQDLDAQVFLDAAARARPVWPTG